ncbi:MAG: hypothetical protein LUD77_08475, partial [Clostridiales bacterium]|nr:hypothetical protein [Clostridiales bacterium]
TTETTTINTAVTTAETTTINTVVTTAETTTEATTESTPKEEFVSPPAFEVAGVFGGRNVTFTSDTPGL